MRMRMDLPPLAQRRGVNSHRREMVNTKADARRGCAVPGRPPGCTRYPK